MDVVEQFEVVAEFGAALLEGLGRDLQVRTRVLVSVVGPTEASRLEVRFPGQMRGAIAADQSLSAQYEYSPFGELIRATGPLATANPFRWSTKFWDDDSGLVYYGYRYYSPTLGRWINRDPIEEADLLNLFAAFQNCPLSYVDPDGRSIFDVMRRIAGTSKTLYAIFRLAALLHGDKVPPDIFGKLERERRKIERVVKQPKTDKKGQGGGRDDPPGGIKGKAVALVAALGFVAIEAFVAATDAVLAHATGAQGVSPDAQAMFASLDRGEQGFADLDAINAALRVSGGAGSAATMAVGIFFTAGDEYGAGGEP